MMSGFARLTHLNVIPLELYRIQINIDSTIGLKVRIYSLGDIYSPINSRAFDNIKHRVQEYTECPMDRRLTNR